MVTLQQLTRPDAEETARQIYTSLAIQTHVESAATGTSVDEMLEDFDAVTAKKTAKLCRKLADAFHHEVV